MKILDVVVGALLATSAAGMALVFKLNAQDAKKKEQERGK